MGLQQIATTIHAMDACVGFFNNDLIEFKYGHWIEMRIDLQQLLFKHCNNAELHLSYTKKALLNHFVREGLG